MSKEKQHKKLVPELRFPEFSYDLENVGFADLGEIKIGLTHTPTYIDSGVIFLSSKNISKGYIDFEDVKFISKDEFLSMTASAKPKVGDILFTRVGSNLGNPIILEEDIEFAIFVSLGIFRVNKKASNYYMKYWMDSDYFWEQVEQKVAGGAKNNLNTTWLKEFKLSIPSLPEQQKIANTLTSLDDFLAAEQEKLDALQAHKKGLLQQLFPAKGERVPKVRFGEFEEEWEETTLGDCLDYLQPTPYLVKSTYYDEKYSTPVLTAGKTFVLGYTNEEDGIFQEKLPTIIFDDFTTASKYVDFSFKAKSSAMKMLTAKNSANIRFIYEAMQTINFEVSTHKRHWISVYSNLKLFIPKPDEQQKIANCLSSLDDRIAAQLEKIEALQAHKKGLMQGLFPNLK